MSDMKAGGMAQAIECLLASSMTPSVETLETPTLQKEKKKYMMY
jgi:hypothetical protein